MEAARAESRVARLHRKENGRWTECGERTFPVSAEGESVSLAAAELFPAVRALDGLCTRKFCADLTVAGLDWAALRPGTRLRSGEALLEIVRAGKGCYDDCPLRRRGENCGLPGHVAFARVLTGGRLAPGDPVTMM